MAPPRAKISSQITQNNNTGTYITGLDHVFLNAPSIAARPSVDPNQNSSHRQQVPRAPVQHDSFQDAITKLRNAPVTYNGGQSLARLSFPVLPPPPDTRGSSAAARPTFRPPPNPATYRRTSLPTHFGPPMATSSPTNVSELFIPLPVTPEMNSINSLEELQELFGTSYVSSDARRRSSAFPSGLASPSKAGDIDLPDFGVFGPNAADGTIFTDYSHAQRLPSYKSLVATLLMNQPEIFSTPQLHQTPSLVEASPDLELIAPVYSNRKGLQGTPGMGTNLTLTPTMASPHTNATGLYDLPGQFGYIESDGSSTGFNFGQNGFDNILHMVNTFHPPPSLPSTISPSETYLPTLTPGLYTPNQFLDTPSVGAISPLLETPGQPTLPLLGMAQPSKKRASPIGQPQPFGTPTSLKGKRERSDDLDAESQAGKKRKHTGTRPGISSVQLLPPGAPAQPKTYLTESSTSRKDVPASYKVKPGEQPNVVVLDKIVAKRTANRDSARRSRQRKQQAMESAQSEITWLSDRITQLEDYIRERGLEVPFAPHRSPPQEEMDDLE